MADVSVSILVSDVEYTSWLRSSYLALSQISDNNLPMVDKYELGPDQVDAFEEFLQEASREVLKLFISRQGDVVGVPFEQSSTEITYRFNETEPELTQSDALKLQLNEDVKNAIYSKIAILWFFAKNIDKAVSYYAGKYEMLANSIEKALYLLHD